MGTATSFLRCLCRGLDGFTEFTGKAIAWLTLILILNTCAVVAMRYFLGTGSILLQESITYLHASLFMLAMAYTLKKGGHVRVDVLYGRFSPRKQAAVDALGTLLFLFPLCGLMLYFCWDYVTISWAIGERSVEGGGIPYLYALKTLLLVLPVMLMLQGLSELVKNSLFALGLGGEHTEEKVEML